MRVQLTGFTPISPYMTSSKIVDPRPSIQLQEGQLREFIATSAVTRIQATGKAQGFELHVDIGAAQGVLGNSRGLVRTFSSLNTLAGLVRRLGAEEFIVSIGDFAMDESPVPTAPVKKPRAAATATSRSKSSSGTKKPSSLSSKTHGKE